MPDTYLTWSRAEERRLQRAIERHRKENPDRPNSCEDLFADLNKLWFERDKHKQREKEERERRKRKTI